MMKNVFYLILEALFVLEIFNFLSWLFGNVEKMTWLEKKANFKVHDVTAWLKSNGQTHIAPYLKR